MNNEWLMPFKVLSNPTRPISPKHLDFPYHPHYTHMSHSHMDKTNVCATGITIFFYSFWCRFLVFPNIIPGSLCIYVWNVHHMESLRIAYPHIWDLSLLRMWAASLHHYQRIYHTEMFLWQPRLWNWDEYDERQKKSRKKENWYSHSHMLNFFLIFILNFCSYLVMWNALTL